MKSRFLKQWVFIRFTQSDGYVKAFVEKVGYEANQEAYSVRYEDGSKEPIFLSSVFRIWPVNQKKAKVVDLAKRRLKLVR
jgi:hypothetical protein